MPRASLNQAQVGLQARLHARRPELEQAILARAYGISDPTAAPDHQYVDGLRSAVSVAIDYGFAAVQLGPGRSLPEIPPELLAQARLAARNRVRLDTVLRRYCGGNTAFADIMVEEAEHCDLPRAQLKALLRALASSFDSLLAAVSEEYAREGETHVHGSEKRRLQLLRRLLAGELLDASDLGYDLEGHHLGVVALGAGAGEALRVLGERLDRQLLLAQPDEQASWAWLGGRRPFDSDNLDLLGSFDWPPSLLLAIGEPAHGLPGWRLSHRQAVAALPIAQRGRSPFVRYADVPLLAAILQDDLLATSLRQLYLAPLQAERDGGLTAKETLRAYFAAAGNASSAAAALGVSRRTVSSRLIAIEDRFGRPLDAASAEIEAILRLDEIEQPRRAPLTVEKIRIFPR
ncbi:MAG TPA: helix-turn-helix domain-containing protein [Solirubrobacterales bacterium]|jgi:hypothetical protein|nr:helix-turn-helix domain-containing protein [Solirubrobacterales bacterium]